MNTAPTYPLLALCALAACVPADAEPTAPTGPKEYLSVRTALLDGDLVKFTVQMRNADTRGDVVNYLDCAAAQYTQIRGNGFVGRVTTKVDEVGGLWSGNGVYTLSDADPNGRFTLNADQVVSICRTNNIPMV